MTETQQRFLQAIAERVPLDQIAEVHLFPAIRQGGAETGVAVVAETPVPGADAPPNPESRVPMSRFIVHTARYRLTLKGPDRGKWEVDVVAEADAPLDAVDAVVRGVQRRAGEAVEPERLTGDAFRTALAEPAWTLER